MHAMKMRAVFSQRNRFYQIIDIPHLANTMADAPMFVTSFADFSDSCKKHKIHIFDCTATKDSMDGRSVSCQVGIIAAFTDPKTTLNELQWNPNKQFCFKI